MLCRLTGVSFVFDSNVTVGVHPLAFSYTLITITRVLNQLAKGQLRDTSKQEFYLRIAILLYLDEVIGLPLGSVTFRQPPPQIINDNYQQQVRSKTPPKLIKGQPVFIKEEPFLQRVAKTLSLLDEPIPALPKLKLKDIPCKGTVEFLQGVFSTYQSGKNYTSFKEYLETTMLSTHAIEAIVNYQAYPTHKNLNVLQLSLVNQENLLLLSNRECDFYNNAKILRIKRKIDETLIRLPEELEDVSIKNRTTQLYIPRTFIKVKVNPK